MMVMMTMMMMMMMMMQVLVGLLLMQRMQTHRFQAFALLGFYVVFLVTYCTLFGNEQD